MSGITSCLRYTGPLNADLRKLQTNLVPFKNAHFLISGLAPLTAKASEKYRKSTVQDIAQQMFSKDNVTVKCDPLNPGDDYHGILKARFLASWASWRGNYATKEVDRVLYDLQKDTRGGLVRPFFLQSHFSKLKLFPKHTTMKLFPSILELYTTAIHVYHANSSQDGSRYDKFFPDWIPNSIASNICAPKGPDTQVPLPGESYREFMLKWVSGMDGRS